MFIHQHPYTPFIPDTATKLIVGTLPPPRFSVGRQFPEDVDFCYGSKYGLLWPILDAMFHLELDYANTEASVVQRKEFLLQHGVGICDVVERCERERMEASDLGMKNIQLRDMVGYLKTFTKVNTLLFMGGNSKNGPEYLFRRHLSAFDLQLIPKSQKTPRIHEFTLDGRTIKTISLTSPSSAANRSIGADPHYKRRKQTDPDYDTLKYRMEQYKPFFG